MKLPTSIPMRPSYPIKGEFCLGLIMASWGVWSLAHLPGEDHLGKSWSWLWESGLLIPVSFLAFGLGVFKMFCAYNRWIPAGRCAAFIASCLWVQFAVKTYEAVGATPVIAVYFASAICSVIIVLAEDKDRND